MLSSRANRRATPHRAVACMLRSENARQGSSLMCLISGGNKHDLLNHFAHVRLHFLNDWPADGHSSFYRSSRFDHFDFRGLFSSILLRCRNRLRCVFHSSRNRFTLNMTPLTLEELRRYPLHHYIEYNGSDILVSDLLELFENKEKRTRRRSERRPRQPRKRRERKQ